MSGRRSRTAHPEVFRVVIEYERHDGTTVTEYHGPYATKTAAKGVATSEAWHQSGPNVRRSRVERSPLTWSAVEA